MQRDPRWPGDEGSCSCAYYGRGLSETRVHSPWCPVHNPTAHNDRDEEVERRWYGAGEWVDES